MDKISSLTSIHGTQAEERGVEWIPTPYPFDLESREEEINHPATASERGEALPPVLMQEEERVVQRLGNEGIINFLTIEEQLGQIKDVTKQIEQLIALGESNPLLGEINLRLKKAHSLIKQNLKEIKLASIP